MGIKERREKKRKERKDLAEEKQVILFEELTNGKPDGSISHAERNFQADSLLGQFQANAFRLEHGERRCLAALRTSGRHWLGSVSQKSSPATTISHSNEWNITIVTFDFDNLGHRNDDGRAALRREDYHQRQRPSFRMLAFHLGEVPRVAVRIK